MTIGNSLGSTLLFMQLNDVHFISPSLGSRFMSAFGNVFLIAVILSAVGLLLAIKVALSKVIYTEDKS